MFGPLECEIYVCMYVYVDKKQTCCGDVDWIKEEKIYSRNKYE
jgi:hypothetical protein